MKPLLPHKYYYNGTHLIEIIHNLTPVHPDWRPNGDMELDLYRCTEFVEFSIINGAANGFINTDDLRVIAYEDAFGNFEVHKIREMLWSGNHLEGSDYNEQMEWCEFQVHKQAEINESTKSTSVGPMGRSGIRGCGRAHVISENVPPAGRFSVAQMNEINHNVAIGVSFKAPSNVPPINPNEGDAYMNINDNRVYIYASEKWAPFARLTTADISIPTKPTDNCKSIKPSAFDVTGDE